MRPIKNQFHMPSTTPHMVIPIIYPPDGPSLLPLDRICPFPSSTTVPPLPHTCSLSDSSLAPIRPISLRMSPIFQPRRRSSVSERIWVHRSSPGQHQSKAPKQPLFSRRKMRPTRRFLCYTRFFPPCAPCTEQSGSTTPDPDHRASGNPRWILAHQRQARPQGQP